LPPRNAASAEAAYAGRESAGILWFERRLGVRIVQTAHPRDVAALVLVVGVFLILFIVVLMLGSPTR
jgi:hypothetical protein